MIIIRPTTLLIVLVYLSACDSSLDINATLQQHPYSYGHKTLFNMLDNTSAVVMIGDSMTDENEWHEFFPDVAIANRGIRGQRSADLLQRANSIVSTGADKAFILIGINDIQVGVDNSEIVSNIADLIRALKNNGLEVYIQSVIQITETEEQVNQTIARLNRLLARLAIDTQCEFVDLNKALSPSGYLKAEYTYDGKHLNGRGYVEWVNTIRPLMSKNVDLSSLSDRK